MNTHFVNRYPIPLPMPVVSYFEYTLTGSLTPLYEEKTNAILEGVKTGFVPFSFVKYWDESEDLTTESDKKKRTIILTSPLNIVDYLNNACFKDCNLNITCFYKQRFI